MIFFGVVYLLLGFGLGAGLPLWNREIRLVYLGVFPLHAALFFIWPHVVSALKRFRDYLTTRRNFFDP